ncbi:hypothetical protein HU200_009999 [Digitaria exilis]|uniref:Uncharacterized protein n=1 Tax=Digitaria exilis TaxID=1010633 RepID=A0A835FJW6_9POAL|nr:hypothetical protein HU200_009999 [Digitaria exilis]
MLQIWLLSLGAEHVVVTPSLLSEPSYLDTVSPAANGPAAVLAVGPTVRSMGPTPATVDGSLRWPAATVAAWLTPSKTGSVCTFSFGTQHALSPEQVACVADALALRLRRPSCGRCGPSPCCRRAVSAGVAMLTWPMGADHFVNRMLLREAGVAIDVAEGADAVPDAAQMAKAIATAVGDEGKPIRERAVELGREAVAAVAEGGSSHRDLQELIRLLANVD